MKRCPSCFVLHTPDKCPTATDPGKVGAERVTATAADTIPLPNKPRFQARTEPHTDAELRRIEELVSEFERSNPAAHSITKEYGPGRHMTFADQFRQRLLGQLPWVFVVDAGGGTSLTLLETRFCLLL